MGGLAFDDLSTESLATLADTGASVTATLKLPPCDLNGIGFALADYLDAYTVLFVPGGELILESYEVVHGV
jgi:hypothetical protein